MIGIVVVTHGHLAEGIESAVDLVTGKQQQFATVCLLPGDDPAALDLRVRNVIADVDSGDGVLCLLDILGGTPSNVIAGLINGGHIRALVGVNLPMAIQASFSRTSTNLDGVVAESLAAAQQGVVDLSRVLNGGNDAGSALKSCGASEVSVLNVDAPAPNGTLPGHGDIVLCRVDDRLIHGQVMTSWLNATAANKIMIVDNEASQDQFLKNIFRSSVPENVKIGVFNEEKAADRFRKGFKDDDRVIVLAKTPGVFLRLINAGTQLPEVVLGGMGAREDRTKFFRNISASEEERKDMAALIEGGAKVYVQIVADDQKEDVAKILNS